MRAAFGGMYVVGKRHYHFVIAVVILQGYLGFGFLANLRDIYYLFVYIVGMLFGV